MLINFFFYKLIFKKVNIEIIYFFMKNLSKFNKIIFLYIKLKFNVVI